MPRPKIQRNSASVRFDDVLIGEVVRSLDSISRTCAVWFFGWRDMTCIAIREIETAVIAELTREELRAVREKQRGGQR